MAHESVSDVTMGTETAVDQRDALGPHHVKRSVACSILPTEWVGTEFREHAPGAGCVVARGFQGVGGLGAKRCASGEFVAIHDWKTTRTVPGDGLSDLEHPWSTLSKLRQLRARSCA